MDHQYILLHKAEYLDLDLIIAPRGKTVPTEDYLIVTSATLRDYIDAQTITVEEDVIEAKEDNCLIKNDKYYDSEGKEVTKAEYEKSCANIARACTTKNNKYYDKVGNETTKEQYNKECKS